MLAGAFAGAAAAAVLGSGWLGLLVGILVSTALALVHGFASITHRGNQIVSGVAINLLPPARPSFLARPGSSRAGAPRRWAPNNASRRSICLLPMRCVMFR
jgi:simple sugar transport system permease protein